MPKLKQTPLEAFLRAKAKTLKSDFNDVPKWVIEASNEFIEQSKPTEREIMIERASHYLSDGNLSTEEMCDAIANHKDQYDMIDNVEGVEVWEKVENSFSCDDFLSEIGYVSK